MAVGGGSQRFSVQLNLNWFVFNTGDFSLSFKEVAGTLRRDGGSLLQNSSSVSLRFGRAGRVRGKSQHLPLMPNVKLK